MKKTPDFLLMEEKPNPHTELLMLYDDFSEFDAYCAFFCDAVSALSLNQDDLVDKTAAQGLRLFGGWLKERSSMIKGQVEAAWQTENSVKS